jgi:hypothetical protein
MQTTTIKLTLNNETREVEAFVEELPFYTEVRVSGLNMTTTKGNQQHKGWACFVLKKDSNEYSIKDAIDIRYVGMRGNGHAAKSLFRYVGF